MKLHGYLESHDQSFSFIRDLWETKNYFLKQLYLYFINSKNIFKKETFSYSLQNKLDALSKKNYLLMCTSSYDYTLKHIKALL